MIIKKSYSALMLDDQLDNDKEIELELQEAGKEEIAIIYLNEEDALSLISHLATVFGRQIYIVPERYTTSDHPLLARRD